jgi:hypothetical protein
MDTVLKNFLWKNNLTAPNPKIFYVYGGAILVFKGNFFQHLNLYICPPVVKNRGGHSRGYPIDLLIDFLYGTVGRN